MSFRIKTLAIAVLMAGAGAFTSSAIGQEEGEVVQIEIVNQDGEKVQPAQIRMKKKQDAGFTVQNKDGKIIIVDRDGTKREIDVQGAQSIIVNQSAKSIMKDGKETKETVGKAIIIGPDGKRQEIEIGQPVDGALALGWRDDAFPFAGVFQADRMDNKFMIGVNCEPVSKTLSAQLKLESGTGLVVKFVGEDTPAKAAGVEVHDILMFADDRNLSQQSDLIEAVQTAGKEESKMELTVIRAGKEVGIEIKPVERPAMAAQPMMVPGMKQRLQLLPELNGKDFNLRFKQMGPGLIIGNDMPEDVEKDIRAQMEKQMEEMKRQMQKLEKQMQDQFNQDKDE